MVVREPERDFDEWYRSEHPRVLAAVAFACNELTSRVEDATSEAFLRALERWSRVGQMRNPSGWVTKVAINQVSRRFRRRVHEALLSNPEALLSYVDSDPHQYEELSKALGRLSRRQRHAISLRYIDGMTQQEVSNELEIAPGTAAATLHQARTLLKQSLTHEVDKDD